MAERFDQAAYWTGRHKELYNDPRSVGNWGRSIEENLKGEQVLIDAVRAFARMTDAPKSVADLGCGYGRVAGAFLDEGFDYEGVDVSPEAIEQARGRHPLGRFVVSDLLQWTPGRQFGVVAMLYVLVHFVDDDAWRDMLRKAVSSVAPNGVFVLADEFRGDERVQTAKYAVIRPRSDYVDELRANGFAFDEALRERYLSQPGASGAFHFARAI